MRSILQSELAYQLIALMFSVILVHAVYVGLIRPTAEFELAQHSTISLGRYLSTQQINICCAQRLEQEACHIICVALSIIGLKAVRVKRNVYVGTRPSCNSGGDKPVTSRRKDFARTLEALSKTEREFCCPGYFCTR